ncbi:MAG: hypothetical protein QW168_05770 [Sulfolobales archaeon]
MGLVSKTLSFILDLLSKVSLIEQEKIAIIPRKYLHLFSKTLDLYPSVFVLSSGPGPKAIGNWRLVNTRSLTVENQLIKMRQTELEDYEKLAEVLISYMSPKVTSSLTVVTDLHDESLVIAYKVLRFMRNLGITPHVYLFINFDYRNISDFDKVNLTSLVSATVQYGKYTIIPLSIDRLIKNSTRMEVIDYVEKCLSGLAIELHEHPAIGTYVPLCFRLEPASIFKDLFQALNLIFYISTGLLRFPVESLASGSIEVWKNLYEEARKLERLAENKVKINYIDNDVLDVKALAEFSLKNIVAEGINIISKTVATADAVEILTNLRFLNVIRV